MPHDDYGNTAETLRRAAEKMRPYGFIHGVIADGLLADADALEAGRIGVADIPESIDLATAYLGGFDA